MRAARNFSVHIFFFFCVMLGLHAVFAFSAWSLKARWANVPPVPGAHMAAAGGLGDREFSYRTIGLGLQNLGDTGGRSAPLKQYDYQKLVQWFFLTKTLSPYSDFVPYLAAFYFGAVQDPEKSIHLVEYLHETGKGTGKNSWRWLAQAVHIARYHVKDLDLAYRLAVELANHPDPAVAPWARQMPAFILNQQGEKEAAYVMLMTLMKEGLETLPPQEINAMRAYICGQILEARQAARDPLCAEE